MKIAIPRMGETVAPCFEYCATMAIFNIADSGVVEQVDFPLKSREPLDRVRLLRDQNLYPYLGAIYETGPEQLDLRTGADWDVTQAWKITALFQYLTSPIVDDLFIRVFATYDF